MDFLSCTCKNTAQLCAATAGSALTTPLPLAGSRLQGDVYMLSFKNSNPKKTQEVPVGGRGESLFERKKCVEKFLLDDRENHSRGDGGAQSGEMAAERATIMLVSMSFLFLPFLHQHDYLACNIHFSFTLSFHQSTVIRPHMPQFLVQAICVYRGWS